MYVYILGLFILLIIVVYYRNKTIYEGLIFQGNYFNGTGNNLSARGTLRHNITRGQWYPGYYYTRSHWGINYDKDPPEYYTYYTTEYMPPRWEYRYDNGTVDYDRYFARTYYRTEYRTGWSYNCDKDGCTPYSYTYSVQVPYIVYEPYDVSRVNVDGESSFVKL